VARTRRAVLLGGLALAVAASGSPSAPSGGSAAREELARYLYLESRDHASKRRVRSALVTALRALPLSLQERLRAEATEQQVSESDFLRYALVEGLPVALPLLEHYLPRALAFVVPRQPYQPGLLGAAFLPTTAPMHWRSLGLHSGLGCGIRPGLHLGANQGLAAVTLCGPYEGWVAPGVPPALVAQQYLEATRSPEAALVVLERFPSPRPSVHLLYDCVTGSATKVDCRPAAQPTAVTAAAVVIDSCGAMGEANRRHLQVGLEANLGWLTVAKALALLAEALPGSVRVVLDLDERTGTICCESTTALRF